MQVTSDKTDHAECLEEHADDGHHGQAAVCKLGRQLFGLLSRVRGGQHLEAVVAQSSALVVIEAAAELHEVEVRRQSVPSLRQAPWRLPQAHSGCRRTSSRRAAIRSQASCKQKLNTHRHKLVTQLS